MDEKGVWGKGVCVIVRWVEGLCVSVWEAEGVCENVEVGGRALCESVGGQKGCVRWWGGRKECV